MAQGVRKSITIPGLLAPTVKRRCAEFGYTIFTPYVVELVCYDLRSDAKHSITLEIANDTQTAQGCGQSRTNRSLSPLANRAKACSSNWWTSSRRASSLKVAHSKGERYGVTRQT